jgi:hypothetical protein
VKTAKSQLNSNVPAGPVWLAMPSWSGRGVAIHVPKFGDETIHLMAPETILWNRAGVLSWRDKPDLTWTERAPRRAAYELRLSKLKVAAEFVAHDDWFEQRFTATNLSGQPGEFASSSCFRLQGLAMFYDCEQLRTYASTASGQFVPVRRLARGSSRVRWITRLGGAELGGDPRWAVLAVLSRDKQHVIAAGRADRGAGFSLGTNTLFTCLHTDSAVPVAAGQQVTTREIFWFLDGTLDELRTRIRRDFAAAAE